MEKKQPDIKIFVSHRIDKECETIDNPMYVNVRCGAVYDTRENVTMLGDNTGDNISEKRNSFCELTVMYWAWKNVEADYYGLCHYRRYLSFSKHTEKIIARNYLDSNVTKEFELDNEKQILNKLSNCDILACYPEDIRKDPGVIQKSVYEMCKNRIGDYDLKGVDETIRLINERWPQYSAAAAEYFRSPYAQFYNCFIMKKKFFHDMCEFVFDILFELEHRLDTTYYNQSNQRMLGFMGEHLLGIYYYYQKNQPINIKYTDLVYIHKPEKTPALNPAFANRNVPIVCMCSNYYVPYFAVLLKSLLLSMNSENNYDVIVLHKEMELSKQRDLLNMINHYDNVSLRFVSPHREFEGTDLYIAASCYAEEAYYRVMVPWILDNYEKAITLDCDLIFQNDPAQLLDISFSDDECIAGVKDVAYQGWYKTQLKQQAYVQEKLKLENPLNYINTGVLVMDLTKIRAKLTKNDMLNQVTSNKYQIQEQDALNVIFEKNFKYLEIAWNYYVKVNPVIDNWIEYAPISYKKAYEEAGKEPFIIHYASNPKPWDNPEIPYASHFWRIARETPYYEQLIYRSMIGLSQMKLYSNHNYFRIFCDKLLPRGSKRRKCISECMSQGKFLFNFVSRIYNK